MHCIIDPVRHYTNLMCNKLNSMCVEIAVACGHFSAALHLCVEPGDDPDKQAFSKWDTITSVPRLLSHVLKTLYTH